MTTRGIHARSRTVLSAAGLAAALCWAGAATAQNKICVPQAVGVPGRSGPPDWWTSPDTSSTRDIDPRWKKALRITDFIDGLTGFEGLAVRSLFHPNPSDSPGKKHLYLSFKVEGDNFFGDIDDPVAQQKRVFVGFGPNCTPGVGGCATNKFFVVSLQSADDKDAGGVPIQPFNITGVYRYASEDASKASFTLDTAGTSLVWNATARAWFAPEINTWSMQVRIPVDSTGVTQGLPIDDDYKMFYWVDYTIGKVGSTYLRNVYTWPRDADETAFSLNNVGNITVLKPVDWGQFHLGDDGSADCQIGLSLASSDIGVVDGACPDDSSSLKTATLKGSINRTSPNCFVARPRNAEGAVSVAANKLEVNFRVANWGSSIDFGEWMDLMKYRPSAAPIRNQSAIAPDPGASGTDNVGVLSVTWQPQTDEEQCLYVPGFAPSGGSCPAELSLRGTHQCILAELKAYDSRLVLLNDSIHRNMNFIDASSGSSGSVELAVVKAKSFFKLPRKQQRELIRAGVVRGDLFQRTAGIPRARKVLSPVRARPVSRRAGQYYRLYFRVERTMLEPTINPRLWRKRYQDIDKVYRQLEKPTPLVRPRRPVRGPRGRAIRRAPRRVPRPSAIKLLSLASLTRQVPAFVVNVFRDTGHVMREGRNRFRVLRPQPSFGSYIKPPKTVSGWNLALDGVDKVGADLYKASVIDGGEAVIRVRVEPKTSVTRRTPFKRAEPRWRAPSDARLKVVAPRVPRRIQPRRPQPRIQPRRVPQPRRQPRPQPR